MVPFYGQGMNAGFEGVQIFLFCRIFQTTKYSMFVCLFVSALDCTLLSDLLDRHPNNFHVALKEFSDSRWQDAQAICDLAMYNYTEVSLQLI